MNVLKHLSPPFVDFLRTLKAVHSGVEQAEYSRKGKNGGIVRREPVEHVHPIIRRHPVTGEEALYINKGFTRRIIGLKREESGAFVPVTHQLTSYMYHGLIDNLLNFLYDHVAKNADSQARLKWAPYTVAIWDNRITNHASLPFISSSLVTQLISQQSAIVDFRETKERRHGARITPQAERPIPANPELILDD